MWLHTTQSYHRCLPHCLSIRRLLQLRRIHRIEYQRSRRLFHRRRDRCTALHAHHSASTDPNQLGELLCPLVSNGEFTQARSIAFMQVRNLKYLAPFSRIANVATIISFAIIWYYIFREPVTLKGKEAVGNFREFPLACTSLASIHDNRNECLTLFHFSSQWELFYSPSKQSGW